MTEEEAEEVQIGCITDKFTAWCMYRGRCTTGCGEWVQVCARNRTHAAQEFRYRGWKRTRRFGWMCPACHRHFSKGDV